MEKQTLSDKKLNCISYHERDVKQFIKDFSKLTENMICIDSLSLSEKINMFRKERDKLAGDKLI